MPSDFALGEAGRDLEVSFIAALSCRGLLASNYYQTLDPSPEESIDSNIMYQNYSGFIRSE